MQVKTYKNRFYEINNLCHLQKTVKKANFADTKINSLGFLMGVGGISFITSCWIRDNVQAHCIFETRVDVCGTN